MKKAIVLATAFAAGSALAQVGTWSGGGAGGAGTTSNTGAGGRFGVGPQIPASDLRANGQTPAAARTPTNSASTGIPGSSAAHAPGATPIVSGTTWGAAQPGAHVDPGQAPLEDKGERQSEKP